MNKALALVLLALASLLCAARARAAPCPRAQAAWVTLSLTSAQAAAVPDDQAEALLNRVHTLLQAELERRRVVVCLEAPAGSTPIARVSLQLLAGSSGRIIAALIGIDDMLTGKNVSRRIELARVPVDSRALTIAVGADELLSASWAELSLSRHGQAAPKSEPPAALAPPKARSAKRRAELSLLGRGEVDAAKEPRFGATLRNDWWLTQSFALSLELGYLRGQPIVVADGQIHAQHFLVKSTVAVPLWQAPRASLELGVGARFMRSLVRGEAAPGATASSGAYSSLAGEASLRGCFAFDDVFDRPRLALTSEVGGGVWLREADARDGGTLQALQRSPLLWVGFGLSLQIP